MKTKDLLRDVMELTKVVNRMAEDNKIRPALLNVLQFVTNTIEDAAIESVADFQNSIDCPLVRRESEER